MKVLSYSFTSDPIFELAINDLEKYYELLDINEFSCYRSVQDVISEMFVLKNDTSLLVETTSYTAHFTLKAGFCYDRASISLSLGCINRQEDCTNISSLVHDIMYIVPQEDHGFTFMEAHGLLREIMLYDGARKPFAWRYYFAVLLATPFNWQKRTEWDKYMQKYCNVTRVQSKQYIHKVIEE